MTDERIKELLKLCEEITPEPWDYAPERNAVFCSECMVVMGMGASYLSDAEILANLRFIAEARSALPEALRALQESKIVWEVAIETAYMIARGHQYEDRFAIHGTRQLYWKGRSDAAEEIRAIKGGVICR